VIAPVFRQAARARQRIRGDDLRVLIEVAEHLDVVQYRRVKLVMIAEPLHISEGQVSRALRRLVGAGCIDRSLDPGGSTYRLCMSMPPIGAGIAAAPDLTQVQVVAPLNHPRRHR
jgi:RIO-like serine/threonine protein kinase